MILHNLTIQITIKPIDGQTFNGQILSPKGVIFFTDPKKQSTVPYTDKVNGMVVTYKEGDPTKGIYATIDFDCVVASLYSVRNLKGSIAQLIYDKGDNPRFLITDYKIEKDQLWGEDK